MEAINEGRCEERALQFIATRSTETAMNMERRAIRAGSRVYFIQSGGEGGPIKIGVTRGRPEDRLAALQIGNPEPLRLLLSFPGGSLFESYIHESFSQAWIRGEWFRPAIILRFVAVLARAIECGEGDSSFWCP